MLSVEITLSAWRSVVPRTADAEATATERRRAVTGALAVRGATAAVRRG